MSVPHPVNGLKKNGSVDLVTAESRSAGNAVFRNSIAGFFLSWYAKSLPPKAFVYLRVTFSLYLLYYKYCTNTFSCFTSERMNANESCDNRNINTFCGYDAGSCYGFLFEK